MKGEFSRLTFDPRRHFAGVLQQQGRVGLDADWNEWVEAALYRLKTETTDVIGGCGRPKDHPGFGIKLSGQGTPNPSVQLSAGRLYAGGLLAELEQDVDFSKQTDWPIPSKATWSTLFPQGPAWPGLDFSTLAAGSSRRDLFYAEVWLRHLTALNDEAARDQAFSDAGGKPEWNSRPEVGDLIRERALGGSDTCTRLQTVAQVKQWNASNPAITDCPSACAALKTARPLGTSGALRVNVTPTPPVQKPCDTPLTGGFGGTENRTYRVEIHDPGKAGTATFKWSNENGAFTVRVNATALTSISDHHDIVLQSIGHDQTTQLRQNDWVELCGEETELGMWRNSLAQLVNDAAAQPDGTWTIQLTKSVVVPHAPFLRRWSAGTQTIALGTAFNLDAGSGLSVTFFSDTNAGTDVAKSYFHEMDYWIWAARTCTRDVEPPDLANTPQQPRGIERYYCCLALVNWTATGSAGGGITIAGTIKECPNLFPPLTELPPTGCDCTVCVTAESHNNGTLTIQMAIDEVKKTGGKVCLGPGTYNLTDTINVSPSTGIGMRLRITGAGSGVTTLKAPALLTNASKPAILIEKTFLSSVSVEDLGIWTDGSKTTSPVLSPGITIQDAASAVIQRCVFFQDFPQGNANPENPAISLGGGSGGSVNAVIQENQVLFSNVGVSHPLANQPTESPLLIGRLYVQNNTLLCINKGISLEGHCSYGGAVRISDNAIGECARAGIVIAGQVVPSPPRVRAFNLEITANELRTIGDGIICSVDAVRISGNSMGRNGDTLANGIVLAAPSDDNTRKVDGCQVLNNRINDLLGVGILIRSPAHLRSATIKQNIVRGTGRGGIIMEAGTQADDLSIEDNQLLDIAPSFVVQTGPVAGVTLRSVGDAEVDGNIVKDLGVNSVAGVPWAGIMLLACPSARIGGNYIANIGPPSATGESAGVAISPPFGKALVVDNEIRRSQRSVGRVGNWSALKIGAPLQGAIAAGSFLTLPTAEGLVVISGDRVFEVGTNSQITDVRGNVLDAFGMAETVIIDVAGSCIFSENQCFLDSGQPEVSFVATISAPYVIASGNFLKGQQAAGPSTGLDIHAPKFTILGNISRGIFVNGTPITDPWRSLNGVT